MLNFAMADCFIAGFEAKYFYNFWRPVTAIRAGGTDDNPDTVADPAWNSFLVTPNIPDYPSTHSVLGAAAAEADRKSTRLLQSLRHLVCRLLLEKKKKKQTPLDILNARQ